VHGAKIEQGKFRVLQPGFMPHTLINLQAIPHSALSCRAVNMKQSEKDKLRELEKRARQLEKLLAQKEIQIEFMEKMIDIAREKYNIDINKHPFPPAADSMKEEKG
jgi:hypothetical protein